MHRRGCALHLSKAELTGAHTPPKKYLPFLLQGNLLDIIPSHELLQKGYPKKQLYVIGLAKGYDEAVEVAASVIDEVYRQTGAFEVASYLREKRRRKAE